MIDRIDALAGRIVGRITGAMTNAMTVARKNPLKSTDRPLKLLRNRPPDPQQLALQLDLFSPDNAAQRTDADPQAPGTTPNGAATSPTPSIIPPSHSQHDAPLPGSRRILLGQHVLSYQLRRS